MATRAQVQNFVQQITPIAQQVGAQYGIDPNLIVAQAAHESAYGTAAPGNNFFGVKGSGQTQATQEQGAAGLYNTNASFRTYPSLQASVEDYAQTLARNWPAVVGQPYNVAVQILEGTPGHQYATDANYVSEIDNEVGSLQRAGFDASAPIPPANIPDAPAAPPSVADLYGQHTQTQPVPLAPVQPMATPGMNSPAAAFGVGDSLAFDPVSTAGDGNALPLASIDPTTGHAVVPGMSALASMFAPNSSGSPDDRGELDPNASLMATVGGGTATGAVGSTGMANGSASLAQPAAAPAPAPAPAPAVPTVTVNGHTYAVGAVLPAANGRSYQVQADGTMKPMPHVSIGANTVLGGAAAPIVQNVVSNVENAAPAAIAGAGSALTSLFGGIFGKGQVAPVAAPNSSGSPDDRDSALLSTVASGVPTGTIAGQPTAMAAPAVAANSSGSPDDRGSALANMFSGATASGSTSAAPAAAATSPSALVKMFASSPVGQTYGPAGQPSSAGPLMGGGNPGHPSTAPAIPSTLTDWYGGYVPGGIEGSPNDPLNEATDLGQPSFAEHEVMQQVQQLNPAYTEWMNNQATAAGSGISVSGGANAAVGVNGLATGSAALAPAAPPPPKYITVPQKTTIRVPVAAPAPAVVAPAAPMTLVQMYQAQGLSPADAYAKAAAPAAAAAANPTNIPYAAGVGAGVAAQHSMGSPNNGFGGGAPGGLAGN